MAPTAAIRDRLKGATRWSMTARCPRMAYYAFIGVDPVEPDEETQRRFERGRMDEQWYIQRLRKKHGRRNVRTQKAVPWPDTGLPLGELHQDAFIVSLAQPVEVKSHFSGQPSAHDFIQLAGEIRYDAEAGDTGALVVLDRDLNERIITVTLDDALRQEVERRTQALLDGIVADVEPERVCCKPSDGIGHLCPFVRHCFADWDPPERPVVQSEEVVTLARQLYEISVLKRLIVGSKVDEVALLEALDDEGVDAAIRTLRDARTVKGVEALEKIVKQKLSDAIGSAPEDFLHDLGEYEVGPLVLKRSRVDRAEYTVAATSYETLSVKRVSDAPLPERDYGEVPF